MTDQQRQKIFSAEVINVRQLEKAFKHNKMIINEHLRLNRISLADMHTRVLTLIYCAWVEASFIKLIHTPAGFTDEEIKGLMTTKKNEGLAGAWKKCIELGVNKVTNGPKSNFKPNTTKKLNDIIDEFIAAPASIRNKIAHGQWCEALNSKLTDVNIDLTRELKTINVVLVDRWFKVYKKMQLIVDDLIKSPDKAFKRDHWGHYSELVDLIEKSKDWTNHTKQNVLNPKRRLKPASV